MRLKLIFVGVLATLSVSVPIVLFHLWGPDADDYGGDYNRRGLDNINHMRSSMGSPISFNRAKARGGDGDGRGEGGPQRSSSTGSSSISSSSRRSSSVAMDGCGLVDPEQVKLEEATYTTRTTPIFQWTHLRPEHFTDFFDPYQKCYKRIYPEQNRPELIQANEAAAVLRNLRCSIPVTQSTVQEVIQQYRTLRFIGDSIHSQQFFALICLLNPTTTRHELVYGDLHYEYNFTTTTTNTVSVSASSASAPGSTGRRRTERTSTSPTTTTTRFIYDKIGPRYEPTERSLYKTLFPAVIRASTTQDAIIINSASHYLAQDAHKLQTAMQHIRRLAQQTRAAVFFMEPTPEEWPTSNGMFMDGCQHRCTCRPINDDTLWGLGTFQDRTINDEMYTGQYQYRYIAGRPAEMVFQQLYPRQWQYLLNSTRPHGCVSCHQHDVASKDNSKEGDCVYNCGPNRWRVDLARRVFALPGAPSQPPAEGEGWGLSLLNRMMSSTRSTTPIRLVPVYWQLVSLGTPTSLKPVGDCTHKSTHALWVMNQQLIRTMSENLPM